MTDAGHAGIAKRGAYVFLQQRQPVRYTQVDGTWSLSGLDFTMIYPEHPERARIRRGHTLCTFINRARMLEFVSGDYPGERINVVSYTVEYPQSFKVSPK